MTSPRVPRPIYVVHCLTEWIVYASTDQVVNEIVSGKLEDPIAVYRFDSIEKSTHISGEIADAVAERAVTLLTTFWEEIPVNIRRFCEEHRGVGTVLPAAA